MAAQERDFFADRLSREELEELAGMAGGVRELVATGSPSFKALGVDLAAAADGFLYEAILDEPRLLRRPLLVTDGGTVITGGRAVAEAV